MTPPRWTQLRQRLEEKLDREEFDTWFGPLRAQGDGGNRLVLLAPNQHFVHTLEQGYRPVIESAIEDLEGPALDVLFAVEESPDDSAQPQTSSSRFDPRYRFETFFDCRSPFRPRNTMFPIPVRPIGPDMDFFEVSKNARPNHFDARASFFLSHTLSP